MFKNWLQNVLKTNDVKNWFTVYIRWKGRYVVGITNNVGVENSMLEYQYKTLYYKHETFTLWWRADWIIEYLDFWFATDSLETAITFWKIYYQKTIWDNESKETINIIY